MDFNELFSMFGSPASFILDCALIGVLGMMLWFIFMELFDGIRSAVLYFRMKNYCSARHNGTLLGTCDFNRCPYASQCVFYAPPVSIWTRLKLFFKKKKP